MFATVLGTYRIRFKRAPRPVSVRVLYAERPFRTNRVLVDPQKGQSPH